MVKRPRSKLRGLFHPCGMSGYGIVDRNSQTFLNPRRTTERFSSISLFLIRYVRMPRALNTFSRCSSIFICAFSECTLPSTSTASFAFSQKKSAMNPSAICCRLNLNPPHLLFRNCSQSSDSDGVIFLRNKRAAASIAFLIRCNRIKPVERFMFSRFFRLTSSPFPLLPPPSPTRRRGKAPIESSPPLLMGEGPGLRSNECPFPTHYFSGITSSSIFSCVSQLLCSLTLVQLQNITENAYVFFWTNAYPAIVLTP